MINKHKLSKSDMEALMVEVELLQTLDHHNIVRYFETYDGGKYLFLVMEFCDGGELFDSFEKIQKDGKKYTEK